MNDQMAALSFPPALEVHSRSLVDPTIPDGYSHGHAVHAGAQIAMMPEDMTGAMQFSGRMYSTSANN
jgi:hypothetical protein